jgi:putative Ca2+/H+ antiporter (TMEM165/GDT1 family)
MGIIRERIKVLGITLILAGFLLILNVASGNNLEIFSLGFKIMSYLFGILFVIFGIVLLMQASKIKEREVSVNRWK